MTRAELKAAGYVIDTGWLHVIPEIRPWTKTILRRSIGGAEDLQFWIPQWIRTLTRWYGRDGSRVSYSHERTNSQNRIWDLLQRAKDDHEFGDALRAAVEAGERDFVRECLRGA